MRAAGLRGAGREAADLDQHQRQAELAVGEAVPLEVAAAELAGVLVLDVAEVERRRRLVGVEQRVGLLAVLPVKAGLDPLPDRLQIVERHQAAGVLLDEGPLRRVAGAHVADFALGVAADARGEILQEPLARRQVVGGADVDDDAQVLQPGHAASAAPGSPPRSGRRAAGAPRCRCAGDRRGRRSARPPESPRPARWPRAARHDEASRRRSGGYGGRAQVRGNRGARWGGARGAHDTEEPARTPESSCIAVPPQLRSEVL